MTAPDKIWAYSYDVNTSQGPLDVWKTINTWSDATVQPITAVEYTRTDLAQAAVAAAYEAAAQVAIGRKGFGSDAALVHPYDKGYVAACDAMATAIRALATPDQIAALAAERAATVTVKPLVWSPFMNGYCLHTDTRLAACSTAESIIWTYAIGRKHTYMKTTKPEERAFDDHLSSAWWVETPSRKLIGPFNSDVLAKAAAQADYDARIRSAITITRGDAPDTIAKSDDFVSLPRAEVEALMELLRRAKHCIGDNYLHWQGESNVALAILQERMK